VPLFGPDIVLDNPAFIHPSAQLHGKVTVGDQASIWCNAVVRSESYEVVIGPYSNVQDFVMIHVGAATASIIGSHCSITHRCTIHGCRIGDNCLIGINTTIMDGCEIGDNCIIAGHTFLRENTRIPANSVVMGVPGEVRRTQNNYVRNRINAYFYYRNALAYAKGEYRDWSRPEFPASVANEIKRLERELEAITKAG